LDKRQVSGFYDRKGEKRKVFWKLDTGKSALHTKVAVSLIAVALSIAVLIICVYLVIPAIISNVSDKIDQNFARQMYDSTIIAAAPVPSESAAPAFVQPNAETIKAPLLPRDCFATALAENPDVVGRISIDGLKLNYLVVQSGDNERYLTTGYNGKASHSGAIFLDYRCDAAAQPLKGNYIVYGHNMKNGTMFHKLVEYKEKGFFYNNRIIKFDMLYEDHSWEIFSVYITSTDFYYIKTSFASDQEWLDFLHTVQQKSIFPTDTVLSADDTILTLSTCTYEFDNARLVIQARLLK